MEMESRGLDFDRWVLRFFTEPSHVWEIRWWL
jgi:hypothetical protein